MAERKKIAISCGDLNGVGLETLLKVFSDKRMYTYFIPVVYANQHVVEQHLSTIPECKVDFHAISTITDAKPEVLNIVEIWTDEVRIEFGEPNPNQSKYTILSLMKATEDVIEHNADALVTLPINKDVMNKAEFSYPGHTEYLRERSGVDESLMFLISEDMKVGLITNHFPIAQVAEEVKQSTILKKVSLMNQSLIKDFGIEKPKIAILGLNPHAGDNGLIGTEELTTIIPSIEKLTADGVIAVGPYSADGFFGKAMYSKFDAVMAMYHDQGLLPFKMISFNRGVNFTAGLPFVRTSPDHGTAYNIAGKNGANEDSLRQAFFMAQSIVDNRKVFSEMTSLPN